MTTDLVEKCARAIHAESDDRRFNWASLQGVQRDDFRDMALAVIDALADGVSENSAMVQAFRAQWANRLSKHGETIDAVCARALSAAIRAAKSRDDTPPPPKD